MYILKFIEFMRYALYSSFLLAALPLSALPNASANGVLWNPIEADGRDYLPLDNLRSFYKLLPLPQSGGGGTTSIGNSAISLAFGPGERDLRIQGVHCRLSYPVKTDADGNLMVSEVDIVKLLDPILRPLYIEKRAPVHTVVLDPGHGGHDVGVHAGQIRESDFALLICKKLQGELIKRGYRVILTHEQNQYLSDQRRIDILNDQEQAVFLSLHLNSGRSDYRGIETYTAAPALPDGRALPGNEHDASNIALALAVHSSLLAASDAQDRSCRRAHYSLLNSLNYPGIIVNLGYVSNEEEAARLNSEEYQDKLAVGLADGIDAYAAVMRPEATIKPPLSNLADAPQGVYAAETPPPRKKAENKVNRNDSPRTKKKTEGSKRRK